MPASFNIETLEEIDGKTLYNEKENIKELIENTYDVLKDTPKEELQQKLIEQVALLVHETNQKDRDTIDD